ncbi:MAG TPA: glycerol-3-phosphate dehydrogenase [Telluria sp.]|nr:glycerol-3-phosphate dehydrogenase [Telluria sp.]
MEQIDCDVLVVGGGINGAGIARDAAGRGLSVVLCEKDDLGAHTSSASSKLIHGGLRYLEHYEFSLVRKALREREVLLRSAPHIIWPLRFVMPHDAGQRPAWLIRAGLWLYDRLARREFLPGSESLKLEGHPAGEALKPEFRRGFAYSDAWVDDARLVVLCAMDARERGATILTRTLCGPLRREGDFWHARLLHDDGRRTDVRARCLVNAAGPWAESVRQMATGVPADHALRLVKGSHIVVPKLFDHPFAYIFQHRDKRIVFALPYETDFTLIGTTDVDFSGSPDAVAIGEAETAYLCDVASHYFSKAVTPVDVTWSYSGVRPIVDDHAADPAQATRDFRFDYDDAGAPLLTVWGGKITTFRKLAEEAVARIAPALGNTRGPWTAGAVLPGGDLFGADPSSRGVLEYGEWLRGMRLRYPFLPLDVFRRYGRAYGTRMTRVLEHCKSMADMGPEIVPGLYAAEVYYLTTQEWATTAQDILWRRSKLALHAPPGSEGILAAWLANH